MDEQTHKALIASIEKWERNAEAETPDEYTVTRTSCALCDEFYADDCNGCPVSEATGQWQCMGSPFDDASEAYGAWSWGVGENSPSIGKFRNKAHAAARKEVDFLKSLLPEGADTECKFDAENTVNIRDLPNGSRCIDEGGKVFRVKGDAIQRRPYLGKTSVRICVDTATGQEQRFIRGILVTPLPEGVGHD